MADGGMTTTETKAEGDSAAARLDLRDIARSPASRQLMLLVGVALAVAMGVAVVLWSRAPNYGLLYAGLDQKDASAITQALQASNTPYTLGGDGTSIMAPQADLAAIRLRLAGQGLPQGSANSTTMPGADSPFGMSDLAERTRYQQMLENDLGNTIGGLQSVRSARVHLALPKPSAFIRDNRQASASVLVSLFPGRQLDASQVAAIVHLVSSSVPELDPKQVSVVDQQGQLLTGDAPDSAARDRRYPPAPGHAHREHLCPAHRGAADAAGRRGQGARPGLCRSGFQPDREGHRDLRSRSSGAAQRADQQRAAQRRRRQRRRCPVR